MSEQQAPVTTQTVITPPVITDQAPQTPDWAAELALMREENAQLRKSLLALQPTQTSNLVGKTVFYVQNQAPKIGVIKSEEKQGWLTVEDGGVEDHVRSGTIVLDPALIDVMRPHVITSVDVTPKSPTPKKRGRPSKE